jgi:hypothetical protein
MAEEMGLTKEPYAAGFIPNNVIEEKRNVVGTLVAKATLLLERRGLRLIAPRTRALLSSQIHELVLTDEPNAAPNHTVDRVFILGFMEVKTGGIVAVGDSVSVAEKVIGHVAGFDETHMPNHMNLVIVAKQLTGQSLEVGTEITIHS